MNFNDLLNMGEVTLDDVSTEPVKGVIDENLYSINLKDAQNGVYKARVRFLPNPMDIKKSIISKYYYFLKDANGDNGIYVDDPSSIGEKSPIGDLYWKLKKSTNIIDNNLSETLKRNRKFYSFVQIIKDEQHPELVGQIKVFGYGIKVKEKIDQEFNDEDGGNPFDIMNAREFKIEVKMVGGYQNYDSCKFAGEKKPINIGDHQLTKTKNDVKVLETFFSNIPNLDDYNFKPWTAELTEQVNERLNTYRKDSSIPSKPSYGNPKSVVEQAIKQDDEPSDDIPFGDSGDDDDLLAGIDI